MPAKKKMYTEEEVNELVSKERMRVAYLYMELYKNSITEEKAQEIANEIIDLKASLADAIAQRDHMTNCYTQLVHSLGENAIAVIQFKEVKK